jgi:two-component system chemotaxis sensor kinase CheA
MLDDLAQEYFNECREHLAGIEGDLLRLEQSAGPVDEALVNKVFRAAHSIKGGAGFFGLSRIRDLAHKTENVLDLVRSGKLAPSSEAVNILLLSFDKLGEMIDHAEDSESADISVFVGALEQLASAKAAGGCAAMRRDIAVTVPDRKTPLKAAAFDLEAAAAAGNGVWLVIYDLIRDVQRCGKTPLDVLRSLLEHGSILDTAFDLESVGTLEDEPAKELGLHVLYSTGLEGERLAEAIGAPRDRLWRVGADGVAAPPAPHSVAPAAAATAEAGKDAGPGEGAAASGASAQADSTVRLNVALLDRLMNLAGELVLGRNQLADAVARGDEAMIRAASQQISLVTSNVQETVMSTRMQPVGNLFQKYPRMVRDMARKLGKQVRLVTGGEEVELDKSLLEALSDPLTHMVRNAIDHGIESASERHAAGKEREGELSLRAWHEAGLVVLEVSDDGRGLDAGKIAAKAVAQGLVSAEAAAAMTDLEKLGLAFLPGVSTASRVSELSGRGVGMDVVKTNLDRLNGKVEVYSAPGKGAAFRIKLPLTLAIIPSLLVSAGEERAAIPQVNVDELIRIPAGEAEGRIGRVGSSVVLKLRDTLVPLVDLGCALNIEGHAGPLWERPGESVNVVLVSGGGLQYGLAVERLYDTMDIVVKPLGRHLRNLSEYAGATILGDGRVAVILDVAGLAGAAGVGGAGQEQRRGVDTAAAAMEEIHRLLVFRHSEEETCAVPLHLVARVEKVAAGQVERGGGRRSMRYRGRSLPLMSLSDAAGVRASEGGDSPVVVVLRMGDREVGLLACEPVEVLEAALEIDSTLFRQRGVMGSAVLGDRTLLLLDAFELADAAWPGWNPESAGGARQAATQGGTILVAEDSAFFREQMEKLLGNLGWRVLSAPDGREAWEMLRRHAREIALVLTDIEMPNMDGLQLTRRIRGDAELSSIPVVMLSALAGDADIARGLEAGGTAYCVKLDRDKLLETIRRVLPSGSARRAEAPAGLSELSAAVRRAETTRPAEDVPGRE